MSKIEKLNSLYEKYKNEYNGKEIVLGDGDVNSNLMLIGEAPGKDEVSLLKPFVGMAGKNLAEFLNILNIKREDIFITNAIKYRLSKINPQTQRVVNRPAAKDEIEQNRQYLFEEIAIVNPQYIVTLGNVPLKAVTHNDKASIGEVHGQIVTISIMDKYYTLFPLYHPASIIYNSSLKNIYKEDILKLGRIITQE